jgi:hypothetical protein
MAEVNKVSCGTLLKGNTGIPTCYLDLKLLVGMILTPVGFKLTKSQIDTQLLTTLQAATLAGRTTRIYPIINFEEVKDNTEQPVYQTYGSGRKVLTIEGKYAFEVTYLDGGLCLHNQLRSFNPYKWSAFFVDSDGILVGTKVGDDVMAIPLNLYYASPYTIATTSTAASYKLNVELDPKYLNEEIGFIDTKVENFDIQNEVKGLLNLVIKDTTTLTSGKVEIQTTLSCGGDNIYDTYSTNLAHTGAWIVKNATTKAAIVITSVAAVPANKTIELTIDTTDTHYPATGSKLTIELAQPAVLAATPILMVGYDGTKILTLTV